MNRRLSARDRVSLLEGRFARPPQESPFAFLTSHELDRTHSKMCAAADPIERAMVINEAKRIGLARQASGFTPEQINRFGGRGNADLSSGAIDHFLRGGRSWPIAD